MAAALASRPSLAEARSQAFLIDLSRFVETRGWHVTEDLDQAGELAIPASKLARKALIKTWKTARKRGRRVDSLDDEQRHDLRKALKELRYEVEFFSTLYSARSVKRFSKRLKKLQRICGTVNDATLVKAMFNRKGALRAANPETERSAA